MLAPRTKTIAIDFDNDYSIVIWTDNSSIVVEGFFEGDKLISICDGERVDTFAVLPPAFDKAKEFVSLYVRCFQEYERIMRVAAKSQVKSANE